MNFTYKDLLFLLPDSCRIWNVFALAEKQAKQIFSGIRTNKYYVFQQHELILSYVNVYNYVIVSTHVTCTVKVRILVKSWLCKQWLQYRCFFLLNNPWKRENYFNKITVSVCGVLCCPRFFETTHKSKVQFISAAIIIVNRTKYLEAFQFLLHQILALNSTVLYLLYVA